MDRALAGPLGTSSWSGAVGKSAVWWLIALLIWAPFPLGGAIRWGAALQAGLIALCGMLWVSAASWDGIAFRRIAGPMVLAAATLLWALVQILPGVPGEWIHPIWSMSAAILGKPANGVISINSWRTEAQLLNLTGSAIAFVLAYAMAQRAETAKLLVNAIIAIGAAYAVYAFLLEMLATSQAALFYAVPVPKSIVSGPFMLHNSFATYSGLAALAGVVRVFALGSETVVSSRGLRPLALSLLQFTFGRGAPLVLATLLCFTGVVISASRAGFAATLCGLAALALASLCLKVRQSARRWSMLGAGAALAPMLVLVALTGDTLGNRLSLLLNTDVSDTVRLTLWDAAIKMIADAPWLGLGLGTYQDAYPLYTTQVLPFVLDKAHCDYLEFAAGLGLPAACAWWLAILWLFVLMVRGVRIRHRNRIFPLLGIGATVMVAVHSTVDFSLQIPAVALTYATLLGIGVAQAFRTSCVTKTEF